MSQQDEVLARLLLFMASSPATWIVERVETLRFESDTRLRREVELQLDLSTATAAAPEGVSGAWLPAPLTVAGRLEQPVVAAKDRTGALLARLPDDQVRELAALGFTAAARREIDDVAESTLAVTRRLVTTVPSAALLDPADPALREAVTSLPDGPRLWDNERLRELLAFLVRTSFVVCLVDPSTVRQPVWFAYEDGWTMQRRRFGLLLGRSGTVDFAVDATGAKVCRTFQMRAESPPDLAFTGARIVYVLSSATPDQGDEDVRRTTQVEVDRDAMDDRAAIVVPARATGVQVEAATFVGTLRHEPAGLPVSAFWALLFSALVVGGAGLDVILDPAHTSTIQNLEVAAALLLLLPAAITAVLAAPSSHSLTSTVLQRTRMMLVTGSLTPWVAGVLLATGWLTDWYLLAWLGVITVAVLLAVLAAVQLGSLRRRYTRDQR